MTRKELMAAAKQAEIKGYNQMKNEEMIELLKDNTTAATVQSESIDEIEEVEKEVETPVEEKEVEVKPKPTKKEGNPYKVDKRETEVMTDGQRLALIRADLTRREAVVITDMQRSQTTDDGEAPLEFFSYTVGTVEGNAWVNVGSDERQYIERGILQVMNDIPLDQSRQVPGKMTTDSIKFKTGKRFRITHVEGMTDEEIAEQTARENGRLKEA